MEGSALSVTTDQQAVGPCEKTLGAIGKALIRISQTFWTADNMNGGAKNGMLNRAWIDEAGELQLSVKKPNTDEFQAPKGVPLTESDQAQFQTAGVYEWRDVENFKSGWRGEGGENTGRKFLFARQLFKDGKPMIFENNKTIGWQGSHQEPDHQGREVYVINDAIAFEDSEDCINPSQ